MARSLFLKISLSVGAVVTLSLAIFAYFLIENQTEHLLSAKSKEVEILSQIARNALLARMPERKAGTTHPLPDLFGFPEGLLEIRVLDPQGKVLRSSRKTEEGTSLVHLLAEGVSLGKRPPVVEQKILGRPFLVSLQALPNETPCFSCHGEEKKMLGILHTALPLEGMYRSIAFNRNLLILSTAITLLLMAMAVNMLLNRMVKKPIDQLVRTMSRVEEGDLKVEVRPTTQDELGHLAKSFNSMVEKLSRAQRELEKQQQHQMLQVKYLASLGELAASVAHEIKNPLAGIKLAIQVFAKEAELGAKHRETIQEIMQSIERLDKTMGDLLSYSRIRPPELELCHLPKVIEDALSSIKEEGQLAGVRVERDFDPTLPPLLLDPLQMERSFLNLFLNALQAMPRGGTLMVKTRRHDSGYHLQKGLPLPDRFSRQEGWVEVAVTDTGEGIPPEVLGEIFRPFFTTRAKGTGLGLSLAQRILEQHGGQIFAESKVGGGTTFYLLLPLPSSAAGRGPN